MGLIGSQLGGIAGQGIGSSIGKKLGGKTGAKIGGDLGRVAGAGLGAAFPYFKDGGPVKQTGLAMVHSGEYVLPKGVKPTAAQKAAVAKRKKGAK